MPKTPKVSVIVPVYKAEKYIEKCARSLFEQTLDDIEYIFINDCTPDKSIKILQKILEEYPKRKDQVKIIHHETNKGIATSRNTGLNATTGTYIIHCDSDDWIEPNMYETMYNKAVEGNYDIVWCDYYIGKPGKMKYYSQSIKHNNPSDCIKTMLKGGGLQLHLWDKLVRRSVYTANNIRFPDGLNIREDWVVTIQMYFYSQRICHIKKGFYYYAIRNTSTSNNHTDWDIHDFKIKDRVKALLIITHFFEQNKVLHKYNTELNIAKLNLKHWILRKTKYKKKWNKLFPEANNIEYFSFPFYHPSKYAMWLALNNITIGYTLLDIVSSIINKFNDKLKKIQTIWEKIFPKNLKSPN